MLQENDLDIMFTYKRKNLAHQGNGNILEWNENEILRKRRTHSLDFDNIIIKPNFFSRKDPNYKIPNNKDEEEKQYKSIRRVNALLYESVDNTLKFK